MIKASREKDQITIARVYENKQEHVFRFWDELASPQRKALLEQLGEVDFQLVARLIGKHAGDEEKTSYSAIEPAPTIPLPATEAQRTRREAARRVGEDLLAEGKVAAVMVAGGQASRLGIDGPKGTVAVGPVTDKSLYQLHTEKVAALRRRHRGETPLVVMTSNSTHDATVEFYEAHRYFGMSKAEVYFMRQRMIPAVDKRGKFILAAKDRLFTNPNGHGGAFQALVERGVLDTLKQRGVEQIFYFQVDNPLVVMCDPVFLGYHAGAGSDFSAKVVHKTDASEKVGIFAMLDGHLGVIEYSDLPDEYMTARDDAGRLIFDAGNIAIHLLSTAFVARIAELGYPLPYHRAEKKIPYCNKRGELVAPDDPNGIKFETFIFDAFRHAAGAVVMEVDRAEEFSPVKNPAGVDSLDTAREAVSSQARRWLERGGLLAASGNGDAQTFEISPGYALDEAELLKRQPGRERLKEEKVYLE